MKHPQSFVAKDKETPKKVALSKAKRIRKWFQEGKKCVLLNEIWQRKF